MNDIDEKDQIVELKDIPQSCVGAPNPILLAGEHDVFLSYYLQNFPEAWHGKSVTIVCPETESEPVAVVTFKRCYAHTFGPPNDETFSGHPLAKRGLRPYGVFEIRASSWLRKLEQMNAVHPCHDKGRFLETKKHFIFSFHDTTFECIAEGFTIEVTHGSIKDIVRHILASVR